MYGFLSGLKADARLIARAAAVSAAFGLVGLFLLIVGFGFLTAALWIVIAAHQGMMFAFTLLGILYLALGALFLALALRRPRYRYPPHPYPGAPPPPRAPLVQIAEGFAIGLQAGRAARGPRR